MALYRLDGLNYRSNSYWEPLRRMIVFKLGGDIIHSHFGTFESADRKDRNDTVLSQLDMIQVAGIVTPISASRQSTKVGSTDIWEISPERLFISDEKIGSGAFSDVYKGIIKGRPPIMNSRAQLQISLSFNETQNEVAVKSLLPHVNQTARLNFLTEMKIMKRIGFHPNIVTLMGCISSEESPILITEYCKNGDLMHYLLTNKNKSNHMDTREMKAIAWQICEAMVFLSSRRFIHRDIAARNVLIAQRNYAKIGDFGLCVHCPDGKPIRKSGGKLPVKWMAPESLESMEFSEKTDVWSYGVFLWELFSHGRSPFKELHPNDLLSELKTGKRLPKPEDCPNEIYSIMTECWMNDPGDRLSFEVIKKKIYGILDVRSNEYGYLEFETIVEE